MKRRERKMFRETEKKSEIRSDREGELWAE